MGKGLSKIDGDEARLVLVGRTGTGKSAVGNTILGRKAFISKTVSASVTTSCNVQSRKLSGNTAVVIDTPGLFDTKRTNTDIMQEIAQCILLAAPGAHAICLVMSCQRLTDEFEDTVTLIINLFGEKVYKYMIVVFTGKDNLEHDGITEKEFIDTLPEGKIKELIAKCNGHYIFFNNRANKEDTDKHAEELFKMVLRLPKDNNLAQTVLYSEDLEENLQSVAEPEELRNLDEYRDKVMARKIPYKTLVDFWAIKSAQ